MATSVSDTAAAFTTTSRQKEVERRGIAKAALTAFIIAKMPIDNSSIDSMAERAVKAAEILQERLDKTSVAD